MQSAFVERGVFDGVGSSLCGDATRTKEQVSNEVLQRCAAGLSIDTSSSVMVIPYFRTSKARLDLAEDVCQRIQCNKLLN